MRRGEVWMGAGPGCMAKPRPVVVLQSDAFSREESVTICPLTSDPRSADAPLLRVPVAAGPGTGLELESWAMADKITTVRTAALAKKLGQIPPRTMTALSRAAATFLGLAD
jgi:mRNA interferase MazF